MPRVRTTVNPERVIDVDWAEYTDLERFGLLLGEEDPEPPAPAVPVRREAAKKES